MTKNKRSRLPYRYFNGKKYISMHERKKKSDAKKIAKNIRAKGDSARITKTSYGWMVWVPTGSKNK